MGDTSGEHDFDFGPPREPDDEHDDPDENRTGEQFPPPAEPMRVARQLEPEWRHDGLLTRRHWRGQWMQWQQTHWVEIDVKDIRSTLYERLEHAYYMVMKDGNPVAKPWAPTKTKMADLLEASSAITHLPSDTDPPTWIDSARPGGIVACTNGLLDLGTRELHPLTPDLFNLVSVPFAYDPAAPKPEAWLQFLNDLWPDDPEQIEALQQWFGYVISGHTDQQKILLIVGPTRSGKGTIARVLRELIGPSNITGPTLASLGQNFGLQPLLGKPLAVISDARLGGRDKHLVTERLLTISGEDTITVDRKYRDPYTGKMPTRIMVLTNELPSFGDSSGVIAHRFVVLTLTRSFLGKENTALTDELTAELPGILNWALKGLDRLAAKHRFTEPASSADAVMTMKDDASPMSAFIRDNCTIGADLEVEVNQLWKAWRSWCLDNGRGEKGAGTKQQFGRDLRSVAPSVRKIRPRDAQNRTHVYQGIKVGTTPPDGAGDADGDPFAQNGRESEGLGHNGHNKLPLSTYARAGTDTPTMANSYDRRDRRDHDGPAVDYACRCETPKARQLSDARWFCRTCGKQVHTTEVNS